MKNETRTCVILVEHSRDATVVNERGAGVSADECQIFLRDVWTQADHAERVCISGSLPHGFSLSDFSILLQGLVARGKSVWVENHMTKVCLEPVRNRAILQQAWATV